MTCAQNIVRTSCHFPDSGIENNAIITDSVRNAYTKGKMDILCSLVAYKIIPLRTATYLAGMDKKMFENELWHWQHDWEHMENEED